LNNRAVERTYIWVDNSPVDYVNWQYGKPIAGSILENCIAMDRRSGQWRDIRCTYSRPYICKKNLECSSVISLHSSMVTVTDTYNATGMGADKAILTDEKDYDSIWCTNNTSGTAKITARRQLLRFGGSQKLHRRFTEALQKLYRSFTEALQKLYRSFTEARRLLLRLGGSQKLHRSFTEALQKLYRSFTEALQKLYRSFTEALKFM
ncbi:macrophage mannose receptor 1-like, partial [Paramuricea clavata]